MPLNTEALELAFIYLTLEDYGYEPLSDLEEAFEENATAQRYYANMRHNIYILSSSAGLALEEAKA